MVLGHHPPCASELSEVERGSVVRVRFWYLADIRADRANVSF